MFDFDKDIFYVLGSGYVENGNTFEYVRSKEATAERQEFQIGIKKIDKSSSQPFRIVFLDEDKPLEPAQQFLIRVRRKIRPELLEENFLTKIVIFFGAGSLGCRSSGNFCSAGF